MSNLATTQKLYEAFGRGDVPLILSLIAADVQWEQWADNSAQKAGVPTMQLRSNLGEVGEFFGVAGTLSVKDFQVLNVMEGGNQVAATIVIEYGTPNGGHLRDEEMHLWTFDEAGKICGLRHYTDTAKHIAAWGL